MRIKKCFYLIFLSYNLYYTLFQGPQSFVELSLYLIGILDDGILSDTNSLGYPREESFILLGTSSEVESHSSNRLRGFALHERSQLICCLLAGQSRLLWKRCPEDHFVDDVARLQSKVNMTEYGRHGPLEACIDLRLGCRGVFQDFTERLGPTLGSCSNE